LVLAQTPSFRTDRRCGPSALLRQNDRDVVGAKSWCCSFDAEGRLSITETIRRQNLVEIAGWIFSAHDALGSPTAAASRRCHGRDNGLYTTAIPSTQVNAQAAHIGRTLNGADKR
jgi:hypothetical protein